MFILLIFVSWLLITSLAGLKVISTDAGIIALSIILAAVLVRSSIEELMSAFISTIKEQMKTRHNSDENERN